jgi:signal transduction histidine kinase
MVVDVEDLPLPMLLLPAEGFKVLWANKAAQALLGMPAAEMGTYLEKTLPPHVMVNLLRASEGAGHLVRVPVQLSLRGRPVTLKLSVRPNDEADGNKWLTVEDVTDSVRAERWVNQYETFARALYGHLPYPGWVVDGDDQVVHHNAAYLAELPVCQRAPAEVSPCSARLRGESMCGVGDGLMANSKSWRSMTERVRATGQMAEKELNLGVCGTWHILIFPLPGTKATGMHVGVLAMSVERSLDAPPLHNHQHRIKASASDLQDVREQARATVAREIHDNLGQEMTILSLEVGRVAEQAMRTGASGPLLQQLSSMQDHVARIMKLMRTMVYDLRLDAVEEKGLARATADYVVYFRQRADIQGQLQVMEGWQDPAPDMAQHIFRSVQELLNNVAKHAEASRFAVRLGLEANSYWLEVQDDGNGLPRKVLDGAGLRSLQERAAIYNGTVTVRTRPALQGTAVRLSLPWGV